jgi:hypothetical protein
MNCCQIQRALHKKSRAVIDRPYRLGFATVGALYERPRSIFCAKNLGGEFHRWKTAGAVFALLVQRRWYVRKYSAGLRSGWLMR